MFEIQSKGFDYDIFFQEKTFLMGNGIKIVNQSDLVLK